MSPLSRDQILAIHDQVVEEVPVPEWNGSVLVQSLSGRERDDYEARHVSTKGNSTTVNMRNARAHLVSLVVVDEQGGRIFSEADIAALGKKNAAALDKIFAVGCRLAGITEDDLKELTEGLEDSPFDDSPSD